MRSLLEKLQTETAQIYQSYGYEENPAWIGPLSVLLEADPKPITAVQIALQLKVSQPTMTQSLRGLHTAGFITSAEHPSDRRKKLISLTDEGRKRIARLKPLWESFEAVADELDAEVGGLMARLDALAESLERKPLRSRVGDRMNVVLPAE
jgi:DNA-binding MarR family transcriptional regulator